MKIPTLRGLSYRGGVALLRASFAAEAVISRIRLSALPFDRRPQIAGVVVGRNDDYMPDFEQRLRAMVSWNLEHLLTEVVFVEWNTAPDRDLLSPRIAAMSSKVRAFVVPPSVHRQLGGTDRLPLLEYHAKNVGIRKAGAPWVLATNADALVSYSLARFLRQRTLDDGTAWIAQRIDIPWPEGGARAATLRDVLWYRRVSPPDNYGTGEFLLASGRRWLEARGYDEVSPVKRIGNDRRGAAQLERLGAHLRRAGLVLHLAHPTSCTEGVRPHHGDAAGLEGLPYANPTTWGLAAARETEIADRVWRLEI